MRNHQLEAQRRLENLFGLCGPGDRIPPIFPMFLHFPPVVVNGGRDSTELCIFKMLRMKQGIQKCPKAEKNDPPPPTPHPLDLLTHAVGVGVWN